MKHIRCFHLQNEKPKESTKMKYYNNKINNQKITFN